LANFFSADYWKALYFKAVGGQETAVDPNAMRGTFAGVAAFTGTMDLPAGAISGTFVGTSDFSGVLDATGAAVEEQGGWLWPRLKTKFERARDKAEAEKERLRRLKQLEDDKAEALSIFGRTDKTPAPIEPEPELPPVTVADAAPPVSKPTESLRSPPQVINRRILTLPLRKPDQDALVDLVGNGELEAANALVMAAELQAANARAKQDEEDALILLLLAS